LPISLFSEKDTLDVWANGKKLEAMVSSQSDYHGMKS